jgi:hypothetical protein
MPGTVHPADAPRPTDSAGEIAVWKALKAHLPNGWIAWHSLRIRDKKAYLGEGDFVLAHPQRGMLVLEVKGGQLELQGGHWYSSGNRLSKAPLTQALDFQTKLLRRLADANCRPPAWGAAVAFPETEFDRPPPQDDLRDVVLGKSQLTWLDRIFEKVVERAIPQPDTAFGDWIGRLHAMWGETWIGTLSLGTRARQARERQLALDDAQLMILDSIEEHDRVLVQGGAGTGKTLLAVEAARREAAKGRRALLLCFTQPLRKWLATRLEGTGVEVQTVSGFAMQASEAVDGPWGTLDLTDSEVWRRYYARAADVAERRWDAIVIDEAQDFTFEAWYLVQALAEGKRLWAFHDPGQGYWPDRTPPNDLFGPPFKLTRGKRSPPGVTELAVRYLGQPADDGAIRQAVSNRTLKLVPCAEPSQVARCVGAEVTRLLGEGIPLADIGVVSLRGQTAADAVHHQPKLGEHSFVLADAEGMEETLVADSFLRWKGLERPVIIVADVDPATLRFPTRMHIALTRALSAARVVGALGPGEEWPGLAGGGRT